MDLLVLQAYAAQTATFVAMGVIAALLPAEAPAFPYGRHFRWLAAFALIRGGLGFVELWTLASIPQWWTAALLTASFVCLFEFTRRLCRDVGRRTSAGWSQYTSLAVFIPIIGGTLLVPVLASERVAAYDAAIRYLIALPGGVGAAIALHFTMRGESMARVDRWMTYGLSGGFATYGLLAGLFVDPGAGVSVWLPTAAVALEVTGLPVILSRAAAIAVASLCLGALVYRASHRAALQLRRQTQELHTLTASLESKVAERTTALRGQEAFAQQLINGTPAIILLLSPKGRIEHVNPAFERITGWSLQEVRGNDWLTLLPRRDVPRIGRLLQAAIAGTSTQGNVNPILTRTGEEREIEWYDQVLRDGSGTVTGLVAVGIDVTERQRAQAAAQAIRQRQRNILDSMFAMVGVFDLDGNLREINRAPLEIAGIEPEDVIGRPFWETFWWAGSPVVQARLRAALTRAARGDIVREDFVARIAGGLSITIDAMFGPLRDSDGMIVEVIGSAVDVTDRKTAEEAARRAGDLLQTVVGGAPIALFALDRDGRFTLSEGRALDKVGVVPGALVGQLAHAVYQDAAGFQELDEAFRRALAGEHVVATARLGPVDFEALYVPSVDSQGHIDGVIGVGFDITDRKRTEQALRESEARLRAIVESEPQCVKIVGRDGTLLDMNPAGLRMIGASTLEAVRSLQITDLVDPRYQARYREAIEAVFRGETSEDEYEIVALDGSRHWMEQHAVPMRGASNPACVTAMLAVTRDITSRRAMEEELQRSEQRLRQAQTIAVIGNWELDLVSGHLWWSDEIFRIFEIEQTQFGASYAAFLDAIHPGDREAVNAAYTASLQTREPYQITHRIQTAAGRVKHVEERCETDFAADGAPLRSRGTVQEITVRVEAEEALRASVREKDTLLREVHHRVKNNLQMVSSLLHFQAKRVKHPDDLAAFTDARHRLRSMSLVHEKLYRSSDLSAIDMRDYISGLIAGLREAQPVAGRTIDVQVTADPVRLSIETAMPAGMIVAELLTNVFKHAFRDERDNRRAEVRVTASGSRVEIGVTDNGVGLPGTFSPETSESFGWQLVAALTTQLDGEFRIAQGLGTSVVIAFPAEGRT